MMAIANYSTSIAPVIRRVVDTGGGSANRAILQVMADVFGASVFPLETTNTACLGAALRAYHADRLADGEALPWRDVGRGFTDPRFEDAITPVAAHVPIYAEMRRLYERRASATASSRT
jgi:xylulokinase